MAQKLVVQLFFKAGKRDGVGTAGFRLGDVAENVHHAFRYGIDAFGRGFKLETPDAGVLDGFTQKLRFFLRQVFGDDDASFGDFPVFFHGADDVLNAHVRQKGCNDPGGVFQMGLNVFLHRGRVVKLLHSFLSLVRAFRFFLRFLEKNFCQVVFLAAVFPAGGLVENFPAESGDEPFLLLFRFSFRPKGGVDRLGIGERVADDLGVAQVVAVRHQDGAVHVVGEDFLIGIHDAATLGAQYLAFQNAAAGESSRFPRGDKLDVYQAQHEPDDHAARHAAQDEASSGESGFRERGHERRDAFSCRPQRCGRRFSVKCILRLRDQWAEGWICPGPACREWPIGWSGRRFWNGSIPR